jgi:glycosyltransferase involved in cell wall biosynthesis
MRSAEGLASPPVDPDAARGRPLRIGHVITALGPGGAQAMLLKIVRATQGRALDHTVISLIRGGGVATALEGDGVPVTALGMRAGLPDLTAVAAIHRWLRRERVDVVQSWLYHADLLAALAATTARRPVVWGIRHAGDDALAARRLTRWTRALCARLSGWIPARIVCCADSACRSHVALGYRADVMRVIPNGFDLERFAPDPRARERVRRALDLPEGALVVGTLARFHPDKDHRNLLAAAARVVRAEPRAVFVLAGEGVDPANGAIRGWLDELALAGRVHLLGPADDVPALMAALDVLASPSRTEAFPNVLGEAMASGVPCVATDCGDSREIVGRAGRIVPPRDPAALARGILELLALSPGERAALGAAGLARVRERYDLRLVAARYVELYEEVYAAHRARRAGAAESSRARP